MTANTEQDLFNQAVRHLAAQGGPARARYCLYRTPEGRRCAIGALITDDEYDPEMEMKEVLGLSQDGFLPDRLVPHLSFLTDLQTAHDRALYHNGVWLDPRHHRGIASRLIDVADTHRLDHTIVGECFPSLAESRLT